MIPPAPVETCTVMSQEVRPAGSVRSTAPASTGELYQQHNSTTVRVTGSAVEADLSLSSFGSSKGPYSLRMVGVAGVGKSPTRSSGYVGLGFRAEAALFRGVAVGAEARANSAFGYDVGADVSKVIARPDPHSGIAAIAATVGVRHTGGGVGRSVFGGVRFIFP